MTQIHHSCLFFRLTHWKQDFFLFPHPFQVQKGEKLKGELLIERNKKWRRHLRVTFKFKFFGRDDGNQKVMNSEFLSCVLFFE